MNEVLKTTALLYLNEALEKQEYETCAELVKIAPTLGVKKEDIRNVITTYLKSGQLGGQTEAKMGKNRVGSLTDDRGKSTV
jgi:hypothetical protein